MRICYFDCFSGISGDMVLGALLDCGVDPSSLQEELEKLGLPGWRLEVERANKKGFAATSVKVLVEEEQEERHYEEIVALIAGSCLGERAKERALATFGRLAEAEAKVHGIRVEDVHFHEVGAVDSIIDIVGSCVALELLGIDRCYGSPVPWPGGSIATAHGLLPVPAPATAALLVGWPVRPTPLEAELVTPTGAALLTALAVPALPPLLRPERVGYGAGQMNLPDRPNVLRAVIAQAEQVPAGDSVVVVEANVDDMNPEWLPLAMEKVLAAGALDVFLVPVVMKKGRPGHLLQALCPEDRLEAVAEALLVHTTTLGLRYSRWERIKLERQELTVSTPWGEVRMKVGLLGERMLNAAPEYEDCRRVAEAAGQPLKAVYSAALAAFLKQRPPA